MIIPLNFLFTKTEGLQDLLVYITLSTSVCMYFGFHLHIGSLEGLLEKENLAVSIYKNNHYIPSSSRLILSALSSLPQCLYSANFNIAIIIVLTALRRNGCVLHA